MCTGDSEFPLNLWSRLIQQAQDTLNMLRMSQTHPKLSAYHVLEGVHDFNRVPFAPPGCRATIFNTPEVRSSFGPRVLDAWYVRPAYNHYRGWQFFVTSTGGFRTSGQATFYPQHCTMPVEQPWDEIRRCAQELTDTIQKLTDEKTARPHRHVEALQRLNDIFKLNLEETEIRGPQTTRRLRQAHPQHQQRFEQHHESITKSLATIRPA